MSEKKYRTKGVRVSSSDKSVKDSKHNGYFTIAVQDKTLSQNIVKVKFLDAIIPNNFYNIRSDSQTPAPNTGYANNVLRLQENGEPAAVSAVVPPGQYLLSEYIAALKIAIDAVLVGGNTVAIVQNATTKVLDFTFSLTATTIFNEEDDALSTNARVAGIATTTAESKTVSGDSLSDLSGIGDVYVHSQNINIAGVMTGQTGSISQCFMVSLSDTPFGSKAYRQFDDSILGEINLRENSNMSTLNIRLRDRFGNVLNPGTGDIIFNFISMY